MKRSNVLLLSLCGMLLTAGCGKSSNTVTTVSVQGASKTTLLNALSLKQFATDLPIIPAAAPDLTTSPGSEYYVVTAEQTDNFDFGLRKQDGTDLINPVSGAPVRTTVWGYTLNGVKAGYLGATIIARSTLPGETGKPVVVKYVNDLKSSSGKLLTKHLLTVDPTLDGANMGEPEIRIVTHLHGGHVAPESDGHPMTWVTNDPAARTGIPADAASGRPARPDGNSFTYTYDNDQLASQLWFHDHAMGITRLNVYAGLAANYLLRDSQEDSLNLPKGAYEIPLVIQDKSFNEDGSLHYDTNPLLKATGEQVTDASGNPVYTSKPEFFGNVIVVNGKAWPKLDVEPRKYRFRMLNGSDSRFYNIWLEARDAGGATVAIPADAITQIGNEAGLLPTKVADIGQTQGNALLLATAERADVIVDFSKFPANTSITVRNDAATPFPNGDPVASATTGRIMQFRVTKPLASADTSAVPALPRTPLPLGAPTAPTRYVDLQELAESAALIYDPVTGASMQRLKLLLNGLTFAAAITEKPKLNSVEEWVIINNTPDMHPMHLHLVAFEVIEKGSVAPGTYAPTAGGGPPDPTGIVLRPDTNPDNSAAGTYSHYRRQPHELGRKETIRVPPANEFIGSQGYVRIRARFDRLGTYMWHCHILAHEEHEMMRPFMVVP